VSEVEMRETVLTAVAKVYEVSSRPRSLSF
jgi:hypothetical protein